MLRTLLPLLLLVLPVAAHADPVPARVEIPIKEVDLSDGTRRYSLKLTIDGRETEVGIDTGSVGLRVLARAMGDAGRAAHGERVTYSYGSGTAFAGPVVRVPVAAGGISQAIRVMRIDVVGCAERRTDCPASRVDIARFGIQGDGLPGEGFGAILGIRLHDDPVENPFTALGVRRWIVELPRPGEALGRVILNPDDAEVAAYHRFAVDSGGRTPACLLSPTAQGRICGPTYFDTGAPGLRVFAGRPPAPWPNGTAATLLVGKGDTAQSAPVTIGRREQATGMFAVPTPNARETELSFGIAPFFIWSVLFDAGHHDIGVKPR